MTSRVPDTGPDLREREKLRAKLRRDLAALEQIPAHRREAEHADVRRETVLALLAEIEAATTNS